ncbi:MAG: hypothetical protein ABSE00_04075 [Chitinispirillaceae bacterium]
MQRRFTVTQPILAAAIVATIFCFCYKPTPFVLPQQPYQFPPASEISTFLGTTNTNFKIAYALTYNGPRDIYYVDFNDSAPAPKVLIKPAAGLNYDADKPMISPDGTFVAYGLLEGNNVYGAYIQKLDTTAKPVLINPSGTRPHWYQDPATGLLYLIYSTVYLIEGLTMDTGIGVTYKQQVDTGNGGSAVGSPILIAPYPMNGGLSKDGQYLCTGYQPGCFCTPLPTAALIPINQGVQICNPSIDPDSVTTDHQMMFLNIGGVQNLLGTFSTDPTYPADAQGNLPEHSVLFIVDVSNTVINFIPISIMGSGYAAWQCPQWSNNQNYAIAIAASNDGSTSWDLVLIKNVRTKDGESSLILTVGSGKMNTNSTPSLWIGN